MKPLIEKIKQIDEIKLEPTVSVIRTYDFEVDKNFDAKEFDRLYSAKIYFIKLARDSWGGEEVNFYDSIQDKYSIVWVSFRNGKESLQTGQNTTLNGAPIAAYFKTYESLKAAIDKIGRETLIDIIKNGV